MYNLRLPGQVVDPETGLFHNNHRYYDPATGRYTQPDPIGLEGGLNRFLYVGANPVTNVDPWGLFEAGGPNAEYPGHSDFVGGRDFDWNLEDTDEHSGPDPRTGGDPERHFRPLYRSITDVSNAIATCNREAFQRAMHRGQDYFSHYNKGYRYAPLSTWKNLGLGHVPDNWINDGMQFFADSKFGRIIGKARDVLGSDVHFVDITPDHDIGAWARANAWTRAWLAKWYQKCDCK